MKRFVVVVVLLVLGIVGFWLFKKPKDSLQGPLTLNWHTGVEMPVIVFVHGLGGDAYATWGQSGSSFMELLASDPAFSECGVASIRYPSGLFGRTPSVPEMAQSFAQCLDRYFTKNSHIIIVAHSLGGIIARRGLVLSGWQHRQHQFVTLITLASPFDGSKLPEYVKFLSGFNVPSRQTQSLGIDSDALQLLDQDWRKLLAEHGSRIRQFAAWEGKPIKGVIPVVSSASATQKVPSDCTFCSKDDDHFSIAKPTSLKIGIGKQVRDWALLALSKREYKKGEYTIDENVEVPPGGVLSIEAGATLHFRKGAKVLCKGRFLATGKKDEVITFDFDETSDAQSGLVLRGPDVAGSEFIYCRFQHGHGMGIQKPNPASVNLPPDELWGEKQTILTNVGNSYGGAVLLIGATNVKFTQCEFTNNRAFVGGALAILGSKRIQINGSSFRNNDSGFGGGAVFAQSSDLYIDGQCSFESNRTGAIVDSFTTCSNCKAACGGALYIGFATHCDVRDSRFSTNKASNAGGAIFVQDTNPPDSPLTAVNQLHQIHFTGNESFGDDGGALRVDGESRGHLSDVLFEDNYSRQQPDQPGPAFADESRNGFQLTGVSFIRKGSEYHEVSRTEKQPNNEIPARPVVDDWMQNPKSYRAADQRVIDTIVLHYMSGFAWNDPSFRQQFAGEIAEFESAPQNQEIVRNPSRKYDPRLCKEILEIYGFSCHYLIDRDGVIYHLVRDKDVAFHAGRSVMPESDDRQNVNDFSLGIELLSADPLIDEDILAGGVAFTPEQYDSLVNLLLVLSRKYKIPSKNIVGHSDIAGARAVELKLRTEADKKIDPGPKFDWGTVRTRVEAGLKQEKREPLLQTSLYSTEPSRIAPNDF